MMTTLKPGTEKLGVQTGLLFWVMFTGSLSFNATPLRSRFLEMTCHSTADGTTRKNGQAR
jgi:hypothetical protein